MIGFTYHKDYNKYDLGLQHPLVGDKPRRMLGFLLHSGLASDLVLLGHGCVDDDDLLLVHNEEYVRHVRELSRTGGMLSMDTPAPKGIFRFASVAAGGTVYAAERVWTDRMMVVNPLSGFHHASIDFSSGFCFFNDMGVAIRKLQKERGVSRVAIVDLDVHHGNGTQDIFFDDGSVLNISFHQDGRTLYPGTGAVEKIGVGDGEGFTVNMPFPPGAGNRCYQHAFEEIVPSVLADFRPDMIFFQAGVDTHHSDPLADIMLTYPVYHWFGVQMRKIAQMVCNRLVVCLGGGYNSETCIRAYYNEIAGLMGSSEVLEEAARSDSVFPQVEKMVTQLKKELQGFWEL